MLSCKSTGTKSLKKENVQTSILNSTILLLLSLYLSRMQPLKA